MTTDAYEWTTMFALRHQAIGRRDALAALLLQLIHTRDITLTPEQRDLIHHCPNEETLIDWHLRAITAETAADIFG